MIYLQSRTILVAIKELKDHRYLVGDTFYATLPSQVTKNAFLGANWNRALKYNPITTGEVVRLGYYQMSFDLYYDEQTAQLKSLTKNSFDQQIVEQSHFDEVLKQIILVNNKYKQNYLQTIPNKLWSTQLVNIHQKHQLPVTNFTHFVINSDFDVNQTKGKYKYLVQAGTTTKIEITTHQQVIYTYNQDQLKLKLVPFSYLNLENSQIYLNGTLNLKGHEPLKLMLDYEDAIFVNELKYAILAQFTTFLGDSVLKLIHFFNMTGEMKYLEQELNSYQNLSYTAVIEQLNFKFDQLKSNHYPLIFQVEKLRTILFKFVTTLSELEEFNHQANRFGILLKNEILAIEEKFLELR